MKKEEDKRLLIPKNGFEEEASEGLGRLNREEADKDLRELRGRIERRVRHPRMIWLPAAAAVLMLLVASAVYFAIFKERKIPGTDIAAGGAPIRDTALIAMAEPIHKAETKSAETTTTPGMKGSAQGAVSASPTTAATRSDQTVSGVNKVEAIASGEVTEKEELAEEVIVEAMPKMEKAAISDKKEKVADAAGATPSLGVDTTARPAAPVGGMEEFNKWIDRNIKYPEEVMPRMQQTVIVTFKVAADSTLYDLKAERSPGDLFTREAFRLLREGPKWVPAVNDSRVIEEKVRVSVVFK